MKLLIPKKILYQGDISSYELLTYCYLKQLMPLREMKQYHIYIDSLVFSIFSSTACSKRIKSGIYKATNNLINQKIIIGKEVSRYCYVIETNSLYEDLKNGGFIIISTNDIQKIISTDLNINVKLSLLNYYGCLIDTIIGKITVYLPDGNYKSNIIGNQTQSGLSSAVGIPERTIIRYNKILEDLKVIYICRAKDFILSSDGLLSQLPNVYGRYEDKEYIKKYAHDYKKYKNGYNTVRTKKENINTSRRLAQKYYWLCQGHEYSEREVREIYDYIRANNIKFERMYEKDNNDVYLDKIKDETVFEKFDFLLGDTK